MRSSKIFKIYQKIEFFWLQNPQQNSVILLEKTIFALKMSIYPYIFFENGYQVIAFMFYTQNFSFLLYFIKQILIALIIFPYYIQSLFLSSFINQLLQLYYQQIIPIMKEQNRQLMSKPNHINLPQQDIDNAEMPFYGKCQYSCGECCGFFRTWIPCLFCCCVQYPYQIVPQSFEGIFQRFGKYCRTVKPGLHYVNPCTDTLTQIDVKISVRNLVKQMIITKDNVSIMIDASVYYRVINSRYAFYRIQNYQYAIEQVTYAILKNTCGQFILQDLLQKRHQIANDIQKQVDQYTQEWGINIQDIFIKDIILSKDLQQSLSSAAKERRLAQSKIISAKADVQSAKLMRQAADSLNSKSAMQIRYLQTLKLLGQSGGSKMIFLPQMKDKDRIQHMITQGMIN